jgi:formylglycine-generating enzyme required for sulfatase activity
MKYLLTHFVLLIFILTLTSLGDEQPTAKQPANEQSAEEQPAGDNVSNELDVKHKEWKEKLESAKKAGKLELMLPNVKEPMTFIYIPAGKYLIGLTPEQRDFLVAQSAEPMIAHNILPLTTIELKDGFFILDREVTKQQWEAGYNDNPSNSLVPITNVPWIHCVQCCAVLSNYQKLNVRLPTEIEWECAARNGDDRLLPWTKEYQSFFEPKKNVKKINKAFALNPKNVIDKTPLNIFNLSDNVNEWCWDEYRNQLLDIAENNNAEIKYTPSMLPDCYIEEGKNLYQKESENSPKARTYRGGSFQDKNYNRLIPIRRSAMETEKSPVIGFRLVVPCDAWNWQPPKINEPKQTITPDDFKKIQEALKSRKK